MQAMTILVPETLREQYKRLAEKRKGELRKIHKRAGYQELMRQAMQEYLQKHREVV